jgi:hypothetical protein
MQIPVVYESDTSVAINFHSNPRMKLNMIVSIARPSVTGKFHYSFGIKREVQFVTRIATLLSASNSAAGTSTVSLIRQKYIQDDRKVTQQIPDTCSTCQKINYIEIREKSMLY